MPAPALSLCLASVPQSPSLWVLAVWYERSICEIHLAIHAQYNKGLIKKDRRGMCFVQWLNREEPRTSTDNGMMWEPKIFIEAPVYSAVASLIFYSLCHHSLFPRLNIIALFLCLGWLTNSSQNEWVMLPLLSLEVNVSHAVMHYH